MESYFGLIDENDILLFIVHIMCIFFDIKKRNYDNIIIINSDIIMISRYWPHNIIIIFKCIRISFQISDTNVKTFTAARPNRHPHISSCSLLLIDVMQIYTVFIAHYNIEPSRTLVLLSHRPTTITYVIVDERHFIWFNTTRRC